MSALVGSWTRRTTIGELSSLLERRCVGLASGEFFLSCFTVLDDDLAPPLRFFFLSMLPSSFSESVMLLDKVLSNFSFVSGAERLASEFGS